MGSLGKRWRRVISSACATMGTAGGCAMTRWSHDCNEARPTLMTVCCFMQSLCLKNITRASCAVSSFPRADCFGASLVYIRGCPLMYSYCSLTCVSELCVHCCAFQRAVALGSAMAVRKCQVFASFLAFSAPWPPFPPPPHAKCTRASCPACLSCCSLTMAFGCRCAGAA